MQQGAHSSGVPKSIGAVPGPLTEPLLPYMANPGPDSLGGRQPFTGVDGENQGRPSVNSRERRTALKWPLASVRLWGPS